MPRPKSSLYRRKKHGHRKTAEVQEKKLLSAETVLGDDLVQSTVQEGSHGHGTQCLPHNPLSTEATLKPAKERVSPSPALAAMEVQCTGVLDQRHTCLWLHAGIMTVFLFACMLLLASQPNHCMLPFFV